jgi:hypothetical protein
MMPIDVEYLRDGSFVHVVGRGVVTEEEYLSYAQGLVASRDRTRKFKCALVDWSETEAIQVSSETVRKASDIMLQTADLVPRGAVIAVVAPGALAYSLSRLWEGHIEETGWRTRVFDDLNEAEGWLEAEVQKPLGRFPLFNLRLEPPELENQFRQKTRSTEEDVSRGLMLLSIIFLILSFPTDWQLLGGTAALFWVGLIRGTSVLVALGSILLLRRVQKVSSFDHIVFLWATALVLGVVLSNTMLPADYTTHVAWDLLLTLAVYAIAPLPLSRQVVIAIIISLSDIVLFWEFKILVWPVSSTDVLAAFTCANLVGIFASRELHHRRRQEFLAHQREEDGRRYLERALLEIKTLRGIIPICSNCKQVRTDEGDWRQVEAYVRDRSDAEFSHGICPKCVVELYPELSAEDE